MRRLLALLGSSFATVAVIYMVIVIVAAGAYDLAEGKNITDSLWWAFTTATTTGYGDMYPVTLPGRLIALFLMHFGPGFAFPVMTALMAAKLIVDSDAFTHAEQEQIKGDLAAIRKALEPRCFGSNPGPQDQAENDCLHCRSADRCLGSEK